MNRIPYLWKTGLLSIYGSGGYLYENLVTTQTDSVNLTWSTGDLFEDTCYESACLLFYSNNPLSVSRCNPDVVVASLCMTKHF